MTRRTRAAGMAVTGMLLLAAGCGGSDGDEPAAAPSSAGQLPVTRLAERFVLLPDGVRYPEGITANPATGDIYVSTFDAPSSANPNPTNKVLRFNRQGEITGTYDVGKAPLLGLAFDPANAQVYIANSGNLAGVDSKIQRIGADLTGPTDVAVIPGIGAPKQRTVANPDGSSDTIKFGDKARLPNAMVLDKSGNLYVSDSFQGAIFKITKPQACAPGCDVETFSHDPLLATTGIPPFAANGLALDADESAMYIANTGDDRVLKLDMRSTNKEVTVLAESINGADGLTVDKAGRLWVAANQADEVVALNVHGQIVARLGEFRGIRDDGSPDGLLVPASLVIVDDFIYVTNLAEAITDPVGDEPEESVTHWTVSRIKLPVT